MCGIFAAFNKNNLEHSCDFYEKFRKDLVHRGPDASDKYFSKNVYLGFNRLKIVDLSNEANMPMTDSGNRFILVFNGQIYNYKILRETLLKDCIFKTNSDSEVILEGFKKFGKTFFDKMDGMWAILIYDKLEEKLIISRDRLGIKPLYYSKIKDEVYFASEQKALINLFQEKNLDVSLNLNYAVNFIVRGNNDFKNETIYNEIFLIEEASIIELNFEFKVLNKLFNIEPIDGIIYNKNKFKDIFLENIKKHSHSDVPVASTLSSGIDSSLVFFTLKDVIKKKIKSFSLNFEFFQDQESDIVKKRAIKYNFENIFVNIKEDNIKKKFDHFLDMMDEPFVSDNLFYQSILTEEVSKQNCKVLFVGDGADEFFFGYPKYYYLYFMYKIKSLNFFDAWDIMLKNNLNISPISFISYALKNLIYGFGERNVLVNNFGKEIINSKTIKKIGFDYYKIEKKFKNILHKEMYTRFKFDVVKFNKNLDISGMMNSVEIRVPYLDHKLVSHALQIDYDHHFNEGGLKNVLRTFARDSIPDEIANQKKKFHKPGSINLFVYKYLDKEIQNFFSYEESKKIFSAKIKYLYLNDKKFLNKENSYIWFRYYQVIKIIKLKRLKVNI
tara:strand:- start:3892 stop:5727 length:1836 start_codon:yes stop_codon:yes gene_type:complete